MKYRSVAVFAILLASSAAAQVVVLEDPENDAQASVGGVAPIPSGTVNVDAFDLVSLTVLEATDSFDFALQVKNLAAEPKTELDNGQFNVDFQHGDTSYRIQYWQQFLAGQLSYGANLLIFDQGRQNYVFLDRLDLDVDSGGGVLTATAERDMLLDGNGTAPTLGRELTLWKAFSRAGLIFNADGFAGGWRVEDAMPDVGFGEIDYAIQQGLRQTGHARLYSDNPVRASNGEEATFVYYVEAHNLDSADDRFDLSVTGVPSNWQVTLPAPTIRIDGNGTQEFPVLVSTPFGHQHGAFEDFTLQLKSHRDSNSVGKLQMGIRYLEIPQPAGHHDRIWIHTRTDTTNDAFFGGPLFGGRPPVVAYMNALEADDRDEGLQAPPPDAFCCPIGQVQYNWEVFLEPGLQLGLDFDVNETGSLDLEFISDVPFNDAVLSGYLVHYGVFDDDGFFGPSGGDATVLGEFAPTAPQQINGATRFTTVFTPKGISDLVPYRPGAALAMQLTLTTTGYDVTGTEQLLPRLMSGGVLQLPLFEYRDPVEHVFNSLAGIDLDYVDRSEKFVNPGETVLFNMTLTNEGAVDDVFNLRVNGTNQDWATLLGDDTVFVPTGASRPVVVAVTPPKDALDGDVVDLIITAASEAEPTVQGNIRAVAVVDALIDRADESKYVTDVAKELTKDKDSPGLPLVGLLAALAAIVARRRF